MKKQRNRKFWAVILSAALFVTQLSTVALAKNSVPEDGSIAAFAALPGSVKKQTVTIGTELLELNLPDTVTATIYHVIEDTVIPDKDNTEDESDDSSIASPSDADDSVSGNHAGDSSETDSGEIVTTVTTTTEEIPVIWDSEPAYEGDTVGGYVFTAQVDGYILSRGVKLPRITVTVSTDSVENPAEKPTEEPLPCTKTEGCTLEDGHEGDCVTSPLVNDGLVKTITGWTFVDDENLNEGELALPGVSMDNQADFDTVVSMLPTQISASFEGGTNPATVDIIGWSCPDYVQDEDGNWPLADGYTFTAELPDGYACDPPPSVRVTLGGISLLTINDRYTVGDLVYQETGPKTVQLIGLADPGFTGTVRVPAQISSGGKTYKVTGIGSHAFEGSGITGLDLSNADNLTRVGSDAFGYCTSLTGTVHIPAGVTEIGNTAFLRSGITGLDLSGAASLTRIGSKAFNNCGSLTGTVHIPAEVTEIGDGAFDSSGITGLDLSGAAGLTRIGTYAFWKCHALTGTVFVPATVTEIGTDAFLNSNITGFIAENNTVAALLMNSRVDANKITLSGGGAPNIPPIVTLRQGNLLYRVTGTSTVSVIGLAPGAAGSLDIPAQVTDSNGTTYQVTEIEPYAFENKASITGLNLRDASNLTRIGQGAFSICRNLTGTVRIPGSVTEIGRNAFASSGITGLDLSGATGLTVIERSAFSHCGSLTGTVDIPAGVTEIGAYAFQNTDITGLNLSKAAGLTKIEPSSFDSCRNLTGTVAIPAGVSEIGAYAFLTTGITRLDLSRAAGLTDIGEWAFYGCRGLTGKVDIPASITVIGTVAFQNTGITEAFIQGRLKSIGARAFPPNIPIHCSDPHTQLLVNEALQNENIPTASWDGQSDIPPGAVVTVDGDITINQNVTIGDGAKVTIVAGVTVTMESDAVITVGPDGTLDSDPGATLNGSGTIVIEQGGKLNGTMGSGITVTYRVTVVNGNVTNGDGTGKFPAGAQVSVTASPAPAGQVFDKWTSQDGVSFDNAASASTTFIMPAKAVTVMATYKNSGGGSSTGGSSYTNPDILRGVWMQTDTGIWMFRQTNGAYAKNRWGIVDGQWYYFDGDGKMLIGWQWIGNQWYYLHTEETARTKAGMKEGAMASGWHFDPVYQKWFYLDASGAMVTGWREIDGKWYYFNPVSDGQRGIMYTDAWIDGWYVDENGIWNGEAKKD